MKIIMLFLLCNFFLYDVVHSSSYQSISAQIDNLSKTYPCADLLQDVELSTLNSLWNDREKEQIQSVVFSIIDHERKYELYDTDQDHLSLLSKLEAIRLKNSKLFCKYLESFCHDDCSLLMHAVIRSRYAMIDFLQQCGVNPNQQLRSNYKTALHLAVDDSYHDLRVHPWDRSLIFWFASTSLEHLLRFKNINPNIQDYQGHTALHTAILQNADITIVRQLIFDFKINCSLKNYCGETALDIAVMKGRTDIVQLLQSVDQQLIQPLTALLDKKANDIIIQEQRGRSLSENDGYLKKCSSNTATHYYSLYHKKK